MGQLNDSNASPIHKNMLTSLGTNKSQKHTMHVSTNCGQGIRPLENLLIAIRKNEQRKEQEETCAKQMTVGRLLKSITNCA